MKTCTRCGVQKPHSEFYKSKAHKGGLYSQCRSCSSEAKKLSRARRSPEERERQYQNRLAWRRRNPERVKLHDKRTDFKRNYGITLEDYETMLAAQGGVCKICGRDEPRTGYRLAVDHCHDTKAIRGLLCSHCNRAIGYLQDSPELVRRALDYLEGNLI